MKTTYWRRRVMDWIGTAFMILATMVALVPLISLVAYVGAKGFPALSWHFFTQLPKSVGESGGGIANAIVGSMTLVGLAMLFGLPVGLLAGIYLAEHGRGWFANGIRFGIEVLSGVPSIVVGVFVYTVAVLPVRHFSAWAGGIALAMIMIPTITRSTEEMLKMVPNTLREAGLALGAPQWRVTWDIVLRSAAPGILTGVMLAVARAAGETAPLLFTAFGNRFWQQGLDQPIASLPVQIFTYAISPYDDWHAKAWGGALVLIGLILVTNLIARVYSTWRTGR